MQKNFKIRCSAIGSIMTNPRSGKGLSKTTQSYLQDWYKEQIYNERKQFSSKYTDKGNECEDDAIELAAEHFGWGLIAKNEEHFSNEFLTGTPDIILAESIEDIKCSWDCFTFPLFDEALPEKNYFWQMQGYMALTGKKSAGVVYCLVDGFDQEPRYNGLESKYTIKRFEVERDEKAIEAIYERVKECREYVESIAI